MSNSPNSGNLPGRAVLGDVQSTQVLSQLPRQYDVNEQFPGGFTLGDLIKTNTGIDNRPDTEEAYENLKLLADRLAWIRYNISDYVLHSVYRNSEVNSRVGGTANSLHQKGKAADIEPKGMTVVELFGRLIQPDVAQNFGEIIIEPDEGIVHVTLPDDRVGTGKIMRRSGSNYFRLSQSEQDSYRGGVEPTTASFDAPESSDIEELMVQRAGFPWWIPVVAVLGLLAYSKLK